MDKTLVLSILTSILFSGCTSCLNPKEQDCEKHYDFTVPITIHPARDTFHIGDTIWIESTMPNVLPNNLDGEEVDISNLDLKFDMAITEYNETGYIFSDHLFNFVNQVGGLYHSSVLIRIVYQDSSSQYRKFRAGIIPTSKGTGKGTFHLAFDFLLPDYENAGLLNKGCLDNIAFRYNTNGGRDSSSYQLLPSTFTQTTNQTIFNKSGSFAFRIIE